MSWVEEAPGFAGRLRLSPDDGGLDHGGEDAVGVEVLFGDIEVLHVLAEGVVLVQGDEPVLQGSLDGLLPGPDEELPAAGCGHAGPPEGVVQLPEGAAVAQSGASRLSGDPVG